MFNTLISKTRFDVKLFSNQNAIQIIKTLDMSGPSTAIERTDHLNSDEKNVGENNCFSNFSFVTSVQHRQTVCTPGEPTGSKATTLLVWEVTLGMLFEYVSRL